MPRFPRQEQPGVWKWRCHLSYVAYTVEMAFIEFLRPDVGFLTE